MLTHRLTLRFFALSLSLVAFAPPALAHLDCGDCDRNGQPGNILDALEAARISVGIVALDRETRCACDADSNAMVNTVDALLIAQAAAGLLPGVACPGRCGLPDPDPGEILITEVMPDPMVALDRDGEWLEITNVSYRTVDLHGLTYQAGPDRQTLSDLFPIPLDPGETLLFAASGDPLINGGVYPDHVWAGSFSLNNSQESLRLIQGGRLLLALDYDGRFPFAAGLSMELRQSIVDPLQLPDPNSWCTASLPYGAGDMGTPGFPNVSCP